MGLRMGLVDSGPGRARGHHLGAAAWEVAADLFAHGGHPGRPCGHGGHPYGQKVSCALAVKLICLFAWGALGLTGPTRPGRVEGGSAGLGSGEWGWGCLCVIMGGGLHDSERHER